MGSFNFSLTHTTQSIVEKNVVNGLTYHNVCILPYTDTRADVTIGSFHTLKDTVKHENTCTCLTVSLNVRT